MKNTELLNKLSKNIEINKDIGKNLLELLEAVYKATLKNKELLRNSDEEYKKILRNLFINTLLFDSNEIIYSTFPKEDFFKELQNKSSKLINILISQTELPIKFWAESVFEVTPKTLTKYKKENVKLPSLITELAIKIVHLYNEGTEVFGSNKDFNEWLMKENIGLGNKKPSDLLNTSTGVDSIYEELKRIEFGATA